MAEHQQDLTDRLAATRRRTTEGAAPDRDGGAETHPMLQLQQQVGNTTVARLLAQREAPDDEEQEVRAKHDSALAQREAPDDEEQEVRAKHEVGAEGGPLSGATAGRIQALRGGGAPLDDGTRAGMETSFGTSFQDVRVHTGGEADTLNRGLSARAFTTGSDIFLRGDSSPSDTRLLAHELTHVVQQRTMPGGGGMRVGAADDAHEQHADAVADRVVATQRQTEDAE